MKRLKNDLGRQLISISIIICGVIFISLGLLLPKLLIPIYEKNIYQILEQPLDFVNVDAINVLEDEDIAYLYIVSDNVVSSINLNRIIDLSSEQVLTYIDRKNGKFTYKNKDYYYNTVKNDKITKVSITNNRYINQIRKDIMYTILPIFFLTLLIIYLILFLWSRRLVKKIEHLKEKIDNLDNDNYVDDYKFTTDDELLVLSSAIDSMKETMRLQEEYKNQMYQNISHDFKTPLTVIKSYMEAVEDGIESDVEAKEVIKEQVEKLESKVHSLLYLNKLDYIKDNKNYKIDKVDLVPIINAAIKKFKLQNKDINFKVQIDDKHTFYNGTVDIWEAIIDNILNNFTRYALKEIKIVLNFNKIILYNDGPNIDTSILNDIFTPYIKGIKGQYGLGLSIVKKAVILVGYEIFVKNEKKGVSFIIKKK